MRRAMLAGLLLVVGCRAREAPPPETPTAAPATPAVELTFLYGSEKKEWLTAALERFNASGAKTPAGAAIVVRGIPAGSGQAVADIAAGTVRPDVFSPASSMYVSILNDA